MFQLAYSSRSRASSFGARPIVSLLCADSQRTKPVLRQNLVTIDQARHSIGMRELLSLLFCFFKATLSGQCNLALENLALRQQLAILKRTQKRPAISTKDRLFWVWLSRIWSEWRASLIIVKPDTVIGWHRKGFRLFWTRLSRRKIGGRPSASSQIRALIKQMAQANPLWGPLASTVSCSNSGSIFRKEPSPG